MINQDISDIPFDKLFDMVQMEDADLEVGTEKKTDYVSDTDSAGEAYTDSDDYLWDSDEEKIRDGDPNRPMTDGEVVDDMRKLLEQ